MAIIFEEKPRNLPLLVDRSTTDLLRDSVDVYDVSRKQNFKMRIVLMWKYSDFPEYRMQYECD